MSKDIEHQMTTKHREQPKGALGVPPIRTTGQTIEKVQREKVTIGDLRDRIIELACELRRADSTTDSALCDAVDAYHAALREQAKEGK